MPRHDPTAYTAIAHIMREENAEKRDAGQCDDCRQRDNTRCLHCAHYADGLMHALAGIEFLEKQIG
jgi:hypothetical protein